MKKYILHFSIKVNGSKYRELLNILEVELTSVKLQGCLERAIFQSIEDLNSITYVEEWNDLVLLKSSFKGSRFNFIFGAVKNLADEWEMEVLENMKIKDLDSLTI
jgi:quinol monooxygenase YgiN